MMWSFITLSIAVYQVSCARILGMLPIGAKSHLKFLQPVMRTLVQAGHEVVVYSPFPDLIGSPTSNLTYVYIDKITAVDQSQDRLSFIEEITNYPSWKCMDLMWSYVDSLYKEFISDSAINSLLHSNERFDLIITETMNAQEYTLILSHIFKVPIIGLQAFPTSSVVNSFLGNSLSPSYIPDTCRQFPSKMTLGERLLNGFSVFRGLYYHYTYYIPKLERFIRKDFHDVPSLLQLSNNISLMFINDHLTADYPHPRTPNIIPVAGLHIEAPQPLPQNIKRFMDEASDGVIFFSLGTYVADDLNSRNYFDMLINVFKKLKQRVLWKTRKENIEGLPDNVMTVIWAPQKDILAHPKCVLFITHGSQLSRVETIHFGVPVISIPQFFDQHRNSRSYVEEGVGVMLPRTDVSEKTLTAAISKVLSNSSYRDNMKRLSAIFKDRPMSPAETVVFWTEYVLRHGGAPHLRPASTELRWYQAALLDVLAIIVALIIIFFIFTWIVFRHCCLSRLKHNEKKSM